LAPSGLQANISMPCSAQRYSVPLLACVLILMERSSVSGERRDSLSLFTGLLFVGGTHLIATLFSSLLIGRSASLEHDTEGSLKDIGMKRSLQGRGTFATEALWTWTHVQVF